MTFYVFTIVLLPDKMENFGIIISILFGIFVFVKFYFYLKKDDPYLHNEEARKEVKVRQFKKRNYFFKKQ